MSVKTFLFTLILALCADLGAAEICWFPAAHRENPLQRWFAAGGVHCSDSAPELPPGLWNVFSRDAGAVSLPYLVDGGASPGLVTTMRPAARVIAALPQGTRGIIYLPRLASAFPVGAIPAGYDSWLFVVDGNRPVAVFPLAPLMPGTERHVDATGPGVGSIIGWLSVPEDDRAVLAKETGLSPPLVRASSATASREAEALPPLDVIHGALVRTATLPDESAEWTIGGRGWVSDSRRIRVTSPLSIIDDPLRARAAGNLVVNWSASDDLPALDRSLDACDREAGPPEVEIIVSSCPRPRRGGRPDRDACAALHTQTFAMPPSFGSFTLENIAPGMYRAELRFGKLPPVESTATVAALQQRSMHLIADYIELYGSVMHGGEPLAEDAEIRFPGGYGFASGTTSEYRAALLGIPAIDAAVTVSACDGSPVVTILNDQAIRHPARFNIDIPANELVVSVTDTFTREALRGATVRYAVMSVRMPKRVLLNESVQTASGGRVAIVSLPEREIRLSVAHAGYQRQAIAPFTMPRSGTKEIDVQLVPLRGSHGKVISTRPFENAAVYWFSENGYETERAELSADGTFVYEKSHGESERMVVVSQSHPLWVLRAPVVERRQTINLPFPDAAPVQDIEVALPLDGGRKHLIGVMIGGLRVPQPALHQHQMSTRDGTQVSANEPLLIRRLAVTGPIDILLGPSYDELSSRAGGMDFFALPQYADAARTPVPPGATSITLP